MKRIVRLTESDLTRIVRRVVNESNRGLLLEGNGATAAQKMYDALTKEGLFGVNWSDSESDALVAVRMVKTCTDLDEFITKIKSLSGMDFDAFIDDQMSAVDEEYMLIVSHLGKILSNCDRDQPNFNAGYNSWNSFLSYMAGRGYTPISY
jgi:hypothetical protein